MTLRYREEESSSTGTVALVLVGALAGLAVGVLVAQRMGGLNGLRSRFRRGDEPRELAGEGRGYDAEVADYDDLEDDDEYAYGAEEGYTVGFLEERVLEAFTNDPVLSERAVDIGAIGEGIIELSGWVNTEDEAHHAVTLARGVPGVETVVNRMLVGDREAAFEESARRVADGDPALTESRWEGQGVGTGRRRQGNSSEPDRHDDPRVSLEDRWQSEREAVKHAADEIEGVAERRTRRPRGETGEAPPPPAE